MRIAIIVAFFGISIPLSLYAADAAMGWGIFDFFEEHEGHTQTAVILFAAVLGFFGLQAQNAHARKMQIQDSHVLLREILVSQRNHLCNPFNGNQMDFFDYPGQRLFVFYFSNKEKNTFDPYWMNNHSLMFGLPYDIQHTLVDMSSGLKGLESLLRSACGETDGRPISYGKVDAADAIWWMNIIHRSVILLLDDYFDVIDYLDEKFPITSDETNTAWKNENYPFWENIFDRADADFVIK